MITKVKYMYICISFYVYLYKKQNNTFGYNPKESLINCNTADKYAYVIFLHTIKYQNIYY